MMTSGSARADPVASASSVIGAGRFAGRDLPVQFAGRVHGDALGGSAFCVPPDVAFGPMPDSHRAFSSPAPLSAATVAPVRPDHAAV
jgi:hypothetical protein